MKIFKMLGCTMDFLFIVGLLYAVFSFIALDGKWIMVDDLNHTMARALWCVLLFAFSYLMVSTRR